MACTFRSPRYVEASIKMARTGPRAIESVFGMDCAIVNIAAPDLKPTISYDQLKKREPACLGLGALYKAVPLFELLGQGVSLRLPVGTNRNVQVLGIHSSTLGSACAGKTLAELFAEPVRPQVFVLGEKTVNLFRDSSVQVVSSYSSGSPDLGEKCPTQDVAGEIGNPAATSAVRDARLIVGMGLVGSAPILYSYSVESGGELREASSLTAEGNLRSLALSPDRSRVIGAFDSLNGTPYSAVQAAIVLNGSEAGKFTGSLVPAYLNTSGSSFNDVAFAPLSIGPYVYQIYQNTILQSSYQNSLVTPLVPSAVGIPTVHNLTSSANRLYLIGHDAVASPAHVWVSIAQFETDGRLTIESMGHLSLPLKSHTPLYYEAGLNRLIFGLGATIQYYQIQSPANGSLQQLSQLDFGVSENISGMDFHEPTRTLAVLRYSSARGETDVTFHQLSEAGIIESAPSTIPLVGNFYEVHFLPDGKYLALAEGTEKRLSLYSYSPLTGLTPKSSATFGTEITQMQVLRLY